MPASTEEYRDIPSEGSAMYDGGDIDTIMEEEEDYKPEDPVHTAVRDNDVAAIKRHLAAGHDPNIRDKLGQTPIHVAVQRNCSAAVHELLAFRNTDRNIRTDSGKTALHLALESGNFSVATTLVDNGVDAEVKDESGMMAFDYCLSMRRPLPVKSSFREFFTRHISLLAKLILKSDRKAACILAYWDCPDLLALLIQEDQSTVAFQDKHHQTALHYCFSEDSHLSVDSARVLLNAGADINVRNIDGATPLHFLSGHELCNEPAAQEFVQHVIATHAQLDGMSPLHLAAVVGDADLLKYVAECGADLNVKDKDGFAAIHLGALHGQAEVVRALLRRGAAVDPENQRGQIPLHYAAVLARSTCSLVLLHDGASVNHRDHFGMTPLHKAAGWGPSDMVRLLIRKGSEVNARDEKDQLPIHYSSAKGLPDITELLILKGSLVECPDRNGQTPLHLAAKTGNVDVIKLLLLHRGDPNAQDVKGQSALHLACFHGHREAVQTLINRGASRKVVTSQGFTPDQFASQRGYYGILNTLKEHRLSLSLYAPEQLKTFEMFRNTTAPTRLESLGQEENETDDVSCSRVLAICLRYPVPVPNVKALLQIEYRDYVH